MGGRLLAIGECMVELAQAGEGLMRRGYAGDTFNTAWYARILLPEDWAVDYYTTVGDDTVSDDMLSFMEDAGIGTVWIRRIKGRTPGLYMIHLKDGERSFSYWRDTSAARLLASDGDHLRHAIETSDVIYFSGITLAILSEQDAATLLSELRRAKAAGKVVAFDPNIRPRLWADRRAMLSTIRDGARAATIVMPSFDDEAAHFGDGSVSDTIARYHSLGAPNVIVKNGAEGATVSFSDASVHVPATTVEQVVDTTSAGDSFNGAFLARYLEEGNARDAAAYAARIAARVIGEHGALVGADKLADA
ncbi:sugar kinase [Rhizobiaceae bacterium n13]|uniref:2-dehydro-3-deoxygluconokinase n=1 Tax=Ferirhizobium litorale TaxID=2927786 RepID=A0AAE3U2G0_9HYPH|nr:sugar kinase [Fererhizobium litorale]MDI7860806.1 sugar kinase [Fererhizobium litorale]MDI7920954.1 sugar kinase [Fererhizobium litorale]